MINNRISLAREYLKAAEADFILVTDINNVRYLTGFTGSTGVFILGLGEGWFLTDSRYTSQANKEVTTFPVMEFRSRIEGIASLLLGKSAKKIAFEAGNLTVATFNELAAALPGFELLPIATSFDALRTLKDQNELVLMSRTAELASAAFMSITDSIKPGARERDLALALEFAMKKSGADDKAFDFIVASGERGALPHGRASDKAINYGEMVTFDFGAVLDGYHSDETVTVAIGKVSDEQREVYDIVKSAHDRAMDAVRPGVTFKELDSKARGYIELKGYGAYFGHGLGHGVGLDVHESPTVTFRNDGFVEAGMVITIEPGIYIPGWGGVRIEDTVIVTESGFCCLTKVPKELMIL
jgi:Xaa-Pro aminopeptidase